MEDDLETVKIDLRGHLTAEGLSRSSFGVSDVLRIYRRGECRDLPLCGFTSHHQLLRSIPDVLKVLPQPGAMGGFKLQLVPSQNSEHVAKLVAQQKDNKKKSFPSQSRLAALGISMDRRHQSRSQQENNRPTQTARRSLIPANNYYQQRVSKQQTASCPLRSGDCPRESLDEIADLIAPLKKIKLEDEGSVKLKLRYEKIVLEADARAREQMEQNRRRSAPPPELSSDRATLFRNLFKRTDMI